MDAFHFGPPEAPLYGSWMPPRRTGNRVAVLCNPFGQEAMRAHRAFRQLATLLSRNGVGVLRFDYRGTGDSWGEGEDASFQRWLDDLGRARKEALRRAPGAHLVLVGLRLGATAAACSAARSPGVHQLVLWDPVVRGGELLEELAQGASRAGDGTWWVNGFPLPGDLRRELSGIDLEEVEIDPHARVDLVVSADEPTYRGLSRALDGSEGRNGSVHVVPSHSDWNYTDAVGAILLPRDIIRTIVQVVAPPAGSE